MENKDTNTDYLKVIKVGDQKWEIVETTIGIFFFLFVCLRFALTIFYTGSFQIPTEKNHPHLHCQFPPKIPIWLRSLLYKPSFSSPSPREGVRGMRTKFQDILSSSFMWCYNRTTPSTKDKYFFVYFPIYITRTIWH